MKFYLILSFVLYFVVSLYLLINTKVIHIENFNKLDIKVKSGFIILTLITICNGFLMWDKILNNNC